MNIDFTGFGELCAEALHANRFKQIYSRILDNLHLLWTPRWDSAVWNTTLN